MNRVTIFIPVSRSDYLDKIFSTLELLECDRTKTNILVVVDGDSNFFVDVRNRVEMSKFEQRLCVQYKAKDKLKKYSYALRRKRISDIHNFAKQYIQECDYVFGLEDDTIFGVDTLKKFLRLYGLYPYAGFIQGVQLGRWGNPYVGAWKVNDIYEPTEIMSMLPPEKNSPVWFQQVDAGGFYCYITKRESFVDHNYEPFDGNGLGPDVNFGISLRQQGMLNYIDWTTTTIHRSKDRDVSLLNTKPSVVTLRKVNYRWRQQTHF